jgi:antitoxin YobK
MPLSDYEEASELIASQPDLGDYAGPRDEELVRAVEQRLGVEFPPSYRRFLRDFGAGSFGGQEIYGVIDADFENSGIPDAVWHTFSLRDDGDIPPELVAIYATGDGEQLCVQSGTVDTPMLAIWPGSGEDPEVAESDFGTWLKEIVEEAIEDA